jgi:hypothetical protein
MLMNRLFEPTDKQIVYHYCSAETMKAILESSKLRFTDVNMLNDSQETQWGYAAFEEASTRLIKRKDLPETLPEITVAFCDSVDEVLSQGQMIVHPFVTCFSSDGDSLPQWRAYADDGRGFAIGFRASKMLELPLTMLVMEYDREKQIKEMMQALLAIYFRKNATEQSEREKVFEDCVLMATYMTAFKHDTFAHEHEIRGIHTIRIKRVGENMQFVDLGGLNPDGQRVSASAVSFQIRDNHFSAYLDMPFAGPANGSAVAEVVLGPKNFSNLGNIFLFLGGLGYSDVVLRKSRAPYR